MDGRFIAAEASRRLLLLIFCDPELAGAAAVNRAEAWHEFFLREFDVQVNFICYDEGQCQRLFRGVKDQRPFIMLTDLGTAKAHRAFLEELPHSKVAVLAIECEDVGDGPTFTGQTCTIAIVSPTSVDAQRRLAYTLIALAAAEEL